MRGQDDHRLLRGQPYGLPILASGYRDAHNTGIFFFFFFEALRSILVHSKLDLK